MTVDKVDMICPTCGREVSRHDQPMPKEGDGRDVILTLIDNLKDPLYLPTLLVSGLGRNRMAAVLYHLVMAGKIMSSFVKLNIEDELKERRSIGIRRYRTPLQPKNGQFAPIAAFQEILDAMNYTKQAMMEGVDETSVQDYHRHLERLQH